MSESYEYDLENPKKPYREIYVWDDFNEDEYYNQKERDQWNKHIQTDPIQQMYQQSLRRPHW